MSKYSVIAPKTKEKLVKHFGKTYEFIKNNDLVLDVGCSTGYYARLLIDDKSCIVDGIEIDKEDRAEAKKILRDVYDIDLDRNDWPKNLLSKKYDIIFLGDVIEHVKDASFVLTKLKALLKDNGFIIISTPNIAHITARLELLGGNFEYEKTGILDATHLKYFTLNSLTNLVENTGFQVKEVDYSLNDLHPDSILHHLEQIGLKPNKKFWDAVEKPEARAYQWKIVIEKQDIHKKIMAKKPPIKPMETNYWFLHQVEVLNQEKKKLESLIDEEKKKVMLLSKDLELAKSSFGWRLQNKLKSIVKR